MSAWRKLLKESPTDLVFIDLPKDRDPTGWQNLPAERPGNPLKIPLGGLSSHFNGAFEDFLREYHPKGIVMSWLANGDLICPSRYKQIIALNFYNIEVFVPQPCDNIPGTGTGCFVTHYSNDNPSGHTIIGVVDTFPSATSFEPKMRKLIYGG
ncbi:MAG: hypothetical protein V4526_01655 [Patescibacteria group bacterium]